MNEIGIVVIAVVVGAILAGMLIIRTRQHVLIPPSGASVGTRSGPFTVAEVAQHDNPDDAWIIVEGKVYDITRYVDEHPGGSAILNNVGTDSTKGFNGPQHPETARNILSMYYIGDLS